MGLSSLPHLSKGTRRWSCPVAQVKATAVCPDLEEHITRINHERTVGFYFARGKTDEHAENAAFSLHHLLERSKLAFPLFISETRLRE
jgi:hypothetical protein